MPQIFLLVFLLTALECHHASEPPSPDGHKDPRTYTWKIDTLSYPGSWQIVMEGIWGSSSSDVYVVGHNDRAVAKMFHFDGTSWQAVKLITYEGGLIPGTIDLHAIYGFAKNDIYAVGERIFDNPTPPPNYLDSSLIIHFDGVSWREVPLARSGPFRALWGLWAASPADLWAGGISGTLIHISGNSATVASSPDTCWFSRIGGTSATDVYALAYAFDTGLRDSEFYSLYRYDGKSWSLDDQFVETSGTVYKFGHLSLGAIDGTLYSGGYGFFRKSGTGWQQIFLDNSVNTILGFYGLSRNNIFVVGNSGGLFHYNGSDFYRYSQFVGLPYPLYAVWSDGQEVFAVGEDGLKTYILHGK